jgi:predicted DCC family thiol-disulfide oxidoreductase YuxK
MQEVSARPAGNPLQAICRTWSQIWFTPAPTAPLELIRIGLGFALLIHYGLGTSHLLEFWGNDGWMPAAQAREMAADPWMQSVFFYFTAPWQWIAFHAVFLFCCAALILGWRTSFVKWIVLIGHISYAHRNLELTYGVDKIAASLLIILCLAPIGCALSLDRVRAVRSAKRSDLTATLLAYQSPWAGACTRLVQIQMAALFFFSALEKLRGNNWWDGDALWFLFLTEIHYNTMALDFLVRHYWLGTIACYATVLIELSYPFLIWQRDTRPYLLAAAVFLHLQFAILMDLQYFSFVMIMGHLSFIRPEWLTQLGLWWKRRIGAMEMIYDGRCGFCVRSMAGFTAFDGLNQIAVRDFRTNPSPVVSDAQVEKALYLVLPGGRALPGFEAYRYVVPRVPGLWWLVPLFYLPGLSRLIGRPLYNWIASNRGWVSSVMRLRVPSSGLK